MRTTLTLDSDVLMKIRKVIQSSHQPAKTVYNDLLRSALLKKPSRGKKRSTFHLRTFKGKKGLMPGFSWEMSTSQILDKLDEEDFKK